MLMMVGRFIINSNCGIRCRYRCRREVLIGLSPDGDVSGCGGGAELFASGGTAPSYSASGESGNRKTRRRAGRGIVRALVAGRNADRRGRGAAGVCG